MVGNPKTGGHIDRDVDGLPTGLLVEVARDLVDPLLTPGVDEAAGYISDAVQLLLQHGVTSARACEDGTWPSFCQLADQRRLPIRIFYSAFYDDDISMYEMANCFGDRNSRSSLFFFSFSRFLPLYIFVFFSRKNTEKRC